MTETLVNQMIAFFSDTIPAELTIFVISLMPILELRGGLIAASILGVPLLPAIAICFLGNILPIPFILLLIKRIFEFMKKHNIMRGVVLKLEERAAKKSKKVENNLVLGLLAFVAVPLPGTGGWTGALVAALMDLPIKKSFPVIAAGVFIAGIITASLSYGLPEVIAGLFA